MSRAWTDKWTDLVGALGPFLAASVALWIAWRSTHREEAVAAEARVSARSRNHVLR